MSTKVHAVSKDFAREHLLEIAALRIKVFRDFPYIYDGSVDYEVKYLDRYFNAPNGTFILAIDENLGEKIVGVATAIPLAEEDDFIKKPFIENGKKIDEFFTSVKVYFYPNTAVRASDMLSLTPAKK